MVKEINSIEEFINESIKVQEEIDTYNKNWKSNHHTTLAFRGQADIAYELIPAIGRGRKCSCHTSILDQERNLIELAKYKLPHIFKSNLLPIDLLALLQHYGIPTRLLDVTANPLVALYFASLNDEKDGEIFAFKYDDSDMTNYPIINAIAESYKFAFTTDSSLSNFFDNIINQPYFIEQKGQVININGEQWINKCCNDLLFIHTTEQIERQKLQQGFYILFPNEINNENLFFKKVIKPINKDNKQIVGRFIIKKNGKATIRRHLEFLGMSEATLFSDNIDVVCKNIVEQCKKM